MQRFVFALFLLILAGILPGGIFAQSLSTETHQAVPRNLDLYLVIGQSNMAGRAPIRDEDKAPINGALLYTGDQLNPWVTATNPLNRFSTIRKVIDMQRLSPAYAFARDMTAVGGRNIGLIVNAKGGSGIVQWLPGTQFFADAVRRTREAMAYGTLKGIIWHQGESDSGPFRRDLYLGRMEVLINAFREAFDDPDLPFVAGKVSEAREQRIPFNEILAQLPDLIPHTAVISSEGTATTDSTHFDSPSQILLGERYAEAMLKMVKRQDWGGAGAARRNARVANEGFRRSYNFLHAWMQERDPKSGLIPRNLGSSRDFWNAQDAAADNYPFMVLTAALLDRPVFEKDMRDMLASETKLTSRLGRLPDTYSFSKQAFQDKEPQLDRIIFGASEYVKDGLLPLTEWLGASPWSERMIGILDDIWAEAEYTTPFGNIPGTNVEVNGELLQTLSRIYWMTGDEKYLDWAVRLGDYYLLGDQHPSRDQTSLRLRDHGCEIVSGLCELYFTVAHARPEKKIAYSPRIHQLLDRILEVGLNEHGLMYDVVNPQDGAIVRDRIADNWGYNYNGFYTVYLVDATERYREAIERALNNLLFYRNFDWENGSQDGYADAVEGGLNLYNRLPGQVAQEWLDSEIQVMWSMQDSSHRSDTEAYRGNGIIEGWHGDGNFARTSIMYCLWKTQGTYLSNWREDVLWGAEPTADGGIIVSVKADSDWVGTLYFDQPRHQTVLHLPADYPRINQFPEWFTVREGATYLLQTGRDQPIKEYSAAELLAGIPVELAGGEEWLLRVQEK
ncbi:sialate O-acetylesterase [Flavilitoribacter nigricans]|nr:sialate O-acetylesterase [Flavilitoribacter nigricans]